MKKNVGLKKLKKAVGDVNKPRLSLIPKAALWEMGKALSYGEIKYSAKSWKKGIPISYLLDAAVRHIYEFADGENFDEETKANKLGNAMADLAIAIDLFNMQNLKKTVDDR